MKHVITLLLLICVCSCGVNSGSSVYSYNSNQVIGIEETNSSQLSIIDPQQAKQLIVREIINNGYAISNGSFLQNENNRFLTNVDWGPIVFVHDIGTNTKHEYYYLYYGVMPDSSISVVGAVDALKAVVFAQGMMQQRDSNKLFLLSPEEASGYASTNLGSTNEDMIIDAVYVRDYDSYSYSVVEDWKYIVKKKSGRNFTIGNQEVSAVYVEPFTKGDHKMAPTKSNVASRTTKSRLFIYEDPHRFKSFARKSSYKPGNHLIPIE